MKQPTFKKLILDNLKAMNRQDIAKKINSITYRSYSMGDSVDVRATDLGKEQRETLEALLNEYQDGHFDGMQDLYVYNRTVNKPRTAKYVHLVHEFTPETKAKLTAMIENKWDIPADDRECFKKFNQWRDAVLWRFMSEMQESEFKNE
jgi:hypothetical protein